MLYFSRLRTRLREMAMAKNARKKGRSARNGNAPAPYTKYSKTPYRYSAAYNEWRNQFKRSQSRYENRL